MENRGQIMDRNISYVYLLRERASFSYWVQNFWRQSLFLHGFCKRHV